MVKQLLAQQIWHANMRTPLLNTIHTALYYFMLRFIQHKMYSCCLLYTYKGRWLLKLCLTRLEFIWFQAPPPAQVVAPVYTEGKKGCHSEKKLPHKLLLVLSWHRRGVYLFHFRCQRQRREKEWVKVGDKGTTVGKRCTLYNGWVKVGRFGQGLLLRSVVH